jgi:hypothetical protein
MAGAHANHFVERGDERVTSDLSRGIAVKIPDAKDRTRFVSISVRSDGTGSIGLYANGRARGAVHTRRLRKWRELHAALGHVLGADAPQDQASPDTRQDR